MSASPIPMNPSASTPGVDVATRPAMLASVTGVLLLVMAIAAFVGFSAQAGLVVRGDAAETAARIAGSTRLFQAGFIGYLVAFLLDVPVAILLYVLLRPASGTLSLLAASFRLVYAAIVGADLLNQLGAMLLLGGAGHPPAYGAAEQQGIALLFLDLFQHGFKLALVFFAFHLLALGALLLRSSAPGILGVLMGIAGVAYLVDSSSFFLLPRLNAKLAPFLAVPMTFELVLALWLVVKGRSAGWEATT
jgi:hypothetical protein